MAEIVKLYHGSTEIVEHPLFGKGRADNDYGSGFYCTEHEDLAKEWACTTNVDGYSNEYSLDIDGLCILDMSTVLVVSWLAVLLSNRQVSNVNNPSHRNLEYIRTNFMMDIDNYDIIRGWRADDRYFTYVKYFLNNTIGIRTLSKAMHLGALGEQIVIKSEEAFDRMEFLGADKAAAKEWFPRYMDRMDQVQVQFNDLIGTPESDKDIYAINIRQEGMMPDDPRLF